MTTTTTTTSHLLLSNRLSCDYVWLTLYWLFSCLWRFFFSFSFAFLLPQSITNLSHKNSTVPPTFAFVVVLCKALWESVSQSIRPSVHLSYWLVWCFFLGGSKQKHHTTAFAGRYGMEWWLAGCMRFIRRQANDNNDLPACLPACLCRPLLGCLLNLLLRFASFVFIYYCCWWCCCCCCRFCMALFFHAVFLRPLVRF